MPRFRLYGLILTLLLLCPLDSYWRSGMVEHVPAKG